MKILGNNGLFLLLQVELEIESLLSYFINFYIINDRFNYYSF
jgi:hypothetical protein